MSESTEYKGYTIRPENGGYLILDFGVPVADASTIEEAKHMIDTGNL